MSSSLNAISKPLVLEPAPLLVRSRRRTVANGDSITLVVRRCFQCSAGKSKKLTRRSQFAVMGSPPWGTWPDTRPRSALWQPHSQTATQRTSFREGRAWRGTGELGHHLVPPVGLRTSLSPEAQGTVAHHHRRHCHRAA